MLAMGRRTWPGYQPPQAEATAGEGLDVYLRERFWQVELMELLGSVMGLLVPWMAVQGLGW